MTKNVAILGASNDPSRFAHKAFMLLKRHGYNPLPVSATVTEIDGVPAVPHLADLKEPFDTLTMYVRPEISTKIKNEILQARPNRVIFNPGTENPELEAALKSQGSHVVRHCTLVLLNAGEFEKA
ncbi:MAG: CoA-binding protein [Bdellovibrionaceae bacterium]|nr:CoA-binding protein [Bdellovibrio sp.]